MIRPRLAKGRECKHLKSKEEPLPVDALDPESRQTLYIRGCRADSASYFI
jgi:hypothetical protein